MRVLQIHALNAPLQLCTLINQVTKVLPCYLTLATNLKRLVALGTQVFEGVLKTEAQVVGGEMENFAYGVNDAVAVGVDVVDCGKLGADFGGKAVWERVWDLGKDVVGSCDR